MSTGRSNRLAGQVGEFLVCAELGRLGLIASPFAGNVPTFDVLATDEQCRTVPIQVKATRGDNWPSDARRWMSLDLDHDSGIQQFHGPATLAAPDLIYACVAIAAPGAKDRFFILTQAELQAVCIAGYSRWMQSIGWRRPRNPASFDCRWWIKDIERFENNWALVLKRLASSQPDPALVNP